MYQSDKELQVTGLYTHPCLPQWRARIDEAEKRGYFNREDSELAADWNMCACGEAMTSNPSIERRRDAGQGPEDQALRDLGYYFSYTVALRRRNFTKARNIISQIEDRLEILAERGEHIWQ